MLCFQGLKRGPRPCPLTRKNILFIDSSHVYVGCDLQTTLRRIEKLSQSACFWIHILSWMSVLSNNSWWNSLRHLFMPRRSRAAWRPLLAVSCGLLALGCGVESAVSTLTCDTCYHREWDTCLGFLMNHGQRSMKVFVSQVDLDVSCFATADWPHAEFGLDIRLFDEQAAWQCIQFKHWLGFSLIAMYAARNDGFK